MFWGGNFHKTKKTLLSFHRHVNCRSSEIQQIPAVSWRTLMWWCRVILLDVVGQNHFFENHTLNKVELDASSPNNRAENTHKIVGVKNPLSSTLPETNPSLPNTLWVGDWTHKHLLRRPLGGPFTPTHKVFGGFCKTRVTANKKLKIDRLKTTRLPFWVVATLARFSFPFLWLQKTNPQMSSGRPWGPVGSLVVYTPEI